MQAAFVAETSLDDPLSALRIGSRPEPVARPGGTTVDVRAASLNHHDIWSLKGVGLSAEHLPMILGCDAAGVDSDGRRVLVYPVVDDGATRSVLTERRVNCHVSPLLSTPALLASWFKDAGLLDFEPHDIVAKFRSTMVDHTS